MGQLVLNALTTDDYVTYTDMLRNYNGEIVSDCSGAGGGTFAGADGTFGNITIQGTGNYALTITGSNTFNTFTVDDSEAAKTIRFTTSGSTLNTATNSPRTTFSLEGAVHTVGGNFICDVFSLKTDLAQTISFVDGDALVACTWNLSGSAGNVHTLQGTGVAGWEIEQKYGNKVSADYLNVSHGTANKFYAGNNSTDFGDNVGWIFSSPPALKSILI